jgi:hypothetical protein
MGGDSSFKAFSVSVTDRPKAASPAVATDTGNTQQQQLQPVVEQRPDGGKWQEQQQRVPVCWRRMADSMLPSLINF